MVDVWRCAERKWVEIRTPERSKEGEPNRVRDSEDPGHAQGFPGGLLEAGPGPCLVRASEIRFPF
jgi:hypothetical protein